MHSLENEILKINELKKDLLKTSKCIDNCDKEEVHFYQNLSLEYSKGLKKLYKYLAEEYGVNVCCSRCKINSD